MTLVRGLSRLALACVGLAPLLAVELAAAQEVIGTRPASHPLPVQAPGTRLTFRFLLSPYASGGVTPAMTVPATGWTATLVDAAGRGRMDVENVQGPGLFAAGDYALYDSAHFVIVHPAARTFTVRRQHEPTSSLIPLGLTSRVGGVVASFESLGTGGLVDGSPTQLYRTTLTYHMTVELKAMVPGLAELEPPRYDVALTMDYWFAESTAAVSVPFLSSPLKARAAAFNPVRELLERLRPAGVSQAQIEHAATNAAPFPSGMLLLKTATSTRAVHTAGTAGSDMLMEISGRASTSVDLRRLVIPEGFTADQPTDDIPRGEIEAVVRKWRPNVRGM